MNISSYFNTKSIFLSIGLFVASLFFIAPVEASLPEVKVRDDGFAARFVSQSIPDPIQIEAGETVEVVYTFKNVGTKTWDPSSKNFISAYTMDPRYRASDFQAANWLSYRQTAKVEDVVRPGEVGTLRLQLRVPEKLGTYTEKFWLASDGWSWVKGGYFYADITVVEKKEVTNHVKSSEDDHVTREIAEDIPARKQKENMASGDYKAKRLFVNTKEVRVAGGEQVKVILGFQNLGETTWKNYSIIANEPLGLVVNSTQLTFADESWNSATQIVTQQQEVKQWDATRDAFYIRAPAKKGSYTIQFSLKADDNRIDGLVVEIPVNVTADAPSHYRVPDFVQERDTPVDQPQMGEEPTIRVGLWKNPENAVQFMSEHDNYLVYAGDELKGILPQGNTGSFYQLAGMYTFKSDVVTFTSAGYVRLVPENNQHAIFELKNYNRAVSWKGPYNFNKYRGSFELRRTNDGYDNVYVINELLYEDYVAGISETSNGSPIEYIKALLTAARTYAYYVAEHSTKHDDRYFDVVATTGDQLYLGYMSEHLMPRVKQAQEETRGYMVTYKDSVVITPYYGNSDGSTRAWTDVWGGAEKPWLVSVPAVYDKRDGKSMFGHGVGISARDAAWKAQEEGSDWKELLQYYYTGVEVTWMWE